MGPSTSRFVAVAALSFIAAVLQGCGSAEDAHDIFANGMAHLETLKSKGAEIKKELDANKGKISQYAHELHAKGKKLTTKGKAILEKKLKEAEKHSKDLKAKLAPMAKDFSATAHAQYCKAKAMGNKEKMK